MRTIFKGFSRDIYSSAWRENTSALLDRSCVHVPPDCRARGLRLQSSEGPSVSSENWTGAISRHQTEWSLPAPHSKERKIKVDGGKCRRDKGIEKNAPTLRNKAKNYREPFQSHTNCSNEPT